MAEVVCDLCGAVQPCLELAVNEGWVDSYFVDGNPFTDRVMRPLCGDCCQKNDRMEIELEAELNRICTKVRTLPVWML